MAINWIDGALRNSQHGGTELLTLLVLADSADRNTGETYPGIKRLASMTRTSERTVQRALRTLEESGEIETIEQASHYRTNVYRLNPRLLNRGPIEDPGPRQIDTLHGDTRDTQRVTPATPKPSVNPSEEPDGVYAREEERSSTEQPRSPRDPWDPPEPIEELRARAHRKDVLWQAFTAGLGIDAQSPDYLAIQSRNQQYLVRYADTEIDQDQLTGATAYLLERWRAGGVRARPTLEHVLAALGEYRAWIDDGRPNLSRRATAGAGGEEPTLDDLAWNALAAAREYRELESSNGAEPTRTDHILAEWFAAQSISEAVYRRALELGLELATEQT